MRDKQAAIRVNRREFIIPWFQVGQPEPELLTLWEAFKDFSFGTQSERES